LPLISPGTPAEINEPVLVYLTQNLGWNTEDAKELIDNYSAENNKTWGLLNVNLLQFLDSELNQDTIGIEKPDKLMAGDSFKALSNTLEQLNPEINANKQQNQPPETAKELVFQYLTQNLGWNTEDANELINDYSAQSNETWGQNIKLLHFLDSQLNAGQSGSEKPEKLLTGENLKTILNLLGQLNSETSVNQQQNQPPGNTKEINETVYQYLTQHLGLNTEDANELTKNYSAQSNKTWGNSSKNILPSLNILFDLNSNPAQTPGNSINISNLLSFINDKIHTGQLAANNIVDGQHQEGSNQGLSKGDTGAVAQEKGGKAGVWNQGTQEQAKLVASIFQPNHSTNRRKSTESTLPKEQGNIQNANGDVIKTTRVAGKQTVNDSTANSQQPSQKNNDSPFVTTTTTIKEAKSGNKDTQIFQQIQLQPGRESAPAAQQGLNNSNISQQVQLAARVAPLIQQAVSNNQGTTSLHLKLKPEHLGEVTVRLVYSQGNLQAHFIAASAHARELLDQSMVHLKENLLQLNINLNDASTSSGDESNKWGQQSPFQQKQNKTRESDPSLMSPEELASDDPLNETKISENKGLNHLV